MMTKSTTIRRSYIVREDQHIAATDREPACAQTQKLLSHAVGGQKRIDKWIRNGENRISFGEQKSNTFDMKCVFKSEERHECKGQELQVEGQDTPWP